MVLWWRTQLGIANERIQKMPNVKHPKKKEKHLKVLQQKTRANALNSPCCGHLLGTVHNYQCFILSAKSYVQSISVVTYQQVLQSTHG